MYHSYFTTNDKRIEFYLIYDEEKWIVVDFQYYFRYLYCVKEQKIWRIICQKVIIIFVAMVEWLSNQEGNKKRKE